MLTHLINKNLELYWLIAPDEREDLTKEPKLCVGSLRDDLSKLKKLPSRQFATLVDIDRFANVLIALGEKMSSGNRIN